MMMSKFGPHKSSATRLGDLHNVLKDGVGNTVNEYKKYKCASDLCYDAAGSEQMSAELLHRWNLHNDLVEALEHCVSTAHRNYKSDDSMKMLAKHRKLLAKAMGENK